MSVADRDKRSMIFPVKRLADLGFEIWATRGTGEVLRRNGVRATIVRKHSDGAGPDGEPDIVARILDGQVDLIVNTPFGSPGQSGPRLDGYEIRTAAVRRQIPCVTTVQGLAAAVQGIEAITRGEVGVRSLQQTQRCERRARMTRPRCAPRRRAATRRVMTDGPVAQGSRAAQRQVRATVLTVRRVDAVLRHDGGRAGHRGQVPAGPVRRGRGRRPGDLDAAAPRVLDPRRAARPRRHGGVRVRRRRPGHPLAGRAAHRDMIDIAGPLGRPFPVPRDPVSCLLVGGGYGSAPLFPLADRLRGRGCTVDFLLGAASADRVFGALTARRGGRTATITTEDGSLGVRGLVTDVLGQVIHEAQDRCDLRLRPDGDAPPGDRGWRAATTSRRRSLVEESMACGTGVCMTCVLPVVGEDGVTRMVRSCVDGPVFRGDLVRWDDVGTIPFDALGAPGWKPRPAARAAARRMKPCSPGPLLPGGAAHGRLTCGPGWGMSSCPTPSSPRRAARARAGSWRTTSTWPRSARSSPSRSCWPRAPGRPTPRMAETPSGMLNSIGLQGPGIDAFLQRDLPWLLSRGARAVVSIAGGTVEEFAELAARLSDASGVTAVEVNISCPNVEDRGQVFACDPGASAAVVEAVRGRLPLRHPGVRQAVARRHRHRRDRARLRGGGRRRAVDDQHAARHGDRHQSPCARCWPGSPAACPARRSARSRCAASGRCGRRCRTCRSSGWAGCGPAGTRWSSILAGAGHGQHRARRSSTTRPPASRILRELEEELASRGSSA